MSLRSTIEVIAKLAERGIVERYAIAGAVAAANYVEPTLTEDLDVFISMSGFARRPSGLVLLTPVEQALAAMGYTERTALGIMIDGWPVQFLPPASPLDEEALDQAIEVDIGLTGTPPLKARCLRAEHVVAIAIKVGRLKDLARVQAFLECRTVDLSALKGVIDRHGLMPAWLNFCAKAGIANPLSIP